MELLVDEGSCAAFGVGVPVLRIVFFLLVSCWSDLVGWDLYAVYCLEGAYVVFVVFFLLHMSCGLSFGFLGHYLVCVVWFCCCVVFCVCFVILCLLYIF